MVTRARIRTLFEKLTSANSHNFQKKGGLRKAPEEKGVYIISNKDGEELYVGSTSAEGGIYERLKDHMAINGDSSFTRHHLCGDGGWLLRGRCRFKYIEVPYRRTRAYLRAYAIWILWPKHIGGR